MDKFDQYCVVEVMGHKKFAGRVTEGAFGLVQIDVPESGPDLPAFTKLFGAAAIYGMTPCTEETARQFARYLRLQAFNAYELPSLALPAPKPAPERDPEWDAEDEDPHTNFCEDCGVATKSMDVYCQECWEDREDEAADVAAESDEAAFRRATVVIAGLPITEGELDAFIAAVGSDVPARDPQLEEPCGCDPISEVCPQCDDSFDNITEGDEPTLGSIGNPDILQKTRSQFRALEDDGMPF